MPDEPIEVLIALHDKFNLLDFAGPLEVLSHAQHDTKNKGMRLAALLYPPTNPATMADRSLWQIRRPSR